MDKIYYTLTAKGLLLEKGSHYNIPAKNRNYVYIKLIHDDGWGDLITAIFERDGKTVTVPLVDGVCPIPAEMMDEPGSFSVSVKSADLKVTNKVRISVEESGYAEDNPPEPPPPQSMYVFTSGAMMTDFKEDADGLPTYYSVTEEKRKTLGGSGSGHTILDSGGGALPQRGRLRFDGADVLDDEGGDVTLVRGLKGADGKDGAIGPAGKDGKDGTNGIDGLPGKDGLDGKDGLPGQDGAPGPQGIPGAKGDKGEPGAKGDKGEPGAKGDKGDIGPIGPAGSEGPRGPQGEPGEQGPAGDIGPKGDKGEVGPQGEGGIYLPGGLAELQALAASGALITGAIYHTSD